MIGICLPSRGLIYSKTIECVIRGMQELNKVGIATRYYTCHDLPIPESHNFVTEQALQDGCTKVFFIEEDMYIDEKAFVALATSSHKIVTLQYNDKNGSPHGIIHYNEAGEILWCGLGATVVTKEVFDLLPRPIFRINVRYKIKKKHFVGETMVTDYEEIEPRQVWNDTENKMEKVEDPYKYGGQDIDFCTRVRKLGFKVVMLPEFKAHHFQLVKLGDQYTNNGCHEIRTV